MKTRRIFTVALAAAAVACSTLQVNTDYDATTDFGKYKTFSVKKGTGAPDNINATRLEQSLSGALAARGLKQLPDGGDLSLYSHFKLGKDTQLNTTGYGGWGGWRWGGGMQTTQVEEIPTGTLVVDLVDSATNKAIWRGIAKDQLSTSATPEERSQKANDVAAKLFANYPPGSKK